MIVVRIIVRILGQLATFVTIAIALAAVAAVFLALGWAALEPVVGEIIEARRSKKIRQSVETYHRRYGGAA